MASFTAPSDYTGFYQITQTPVSKQNLQEYIDMVEPIILQDLMGCDLFDLFTADLINNVPQTQRFIAIFDPFCEDDGNTNGWKHRSLGIVEMLKGFVYYDYIRDSAFSSVITGVIKNEFSNSEQARSVENGTNDRYNRGIQTYEQIRWYIDDNPNGDEYPEDNGMEKDIIGWL